MSRPTKFAHWLALQKWNDPASIVEKFRLEMQLAAQVVEAQAPLSIEFDGQRKYLPNIDGKQDQKQYYIASLERHNDGTLWPEITFGSFKARITNQYWSPRDLAWQEFEQAKREGEIIEDSEALRRYRAAIAEQNKLAAKLKKEKEELILASNLAAQNCAIYAFQEHCRPFQPGENHPYLEQKGLTPNDSVFLAMTDVVGNLYSPYYGEWRERGTVIKQGDLIIPMYDASPNSVLWSLQRIGQDLKKSFISGSKKKGLYTRINGKNDIVFISEGYATAKTAHDLTGATCFVAFDCGNLKEIANFAKGFSQGRPVINLADNDLATFYKTGKNPGLDKAKELLDDLEIPFITPEVKQGQESIVSDWDDYRQLHGIELTKKAITFELSKALRLWSGFPTSNKELVPAERLVDNTPKQAEVAINSSSLGGSGNADFEDDEGEIAVMQEQQELIKPSEIQRPTHWGSASLAAVETVPIYSFPHTNDKNTALLDTRENLQFLLESYGIECRYNKISKDNEITIPGRRFTRDNRSNSNLAEIRSLAARNKMPFGSIDKYITSIADQNAYNPVKDWILSREWDGHDRIQAMLDTIVATDGYCEHLKGTLIVKWLLACVAAVMTPDDKPFYSKSVLVLQGDQDAGKTSWMRKLVSPEMADYVKDGIHLDPSNKDTVFTAVSHWIAELGELDATFRKADIARLKAFITQSEDRLRRPYEARDSLLPRRTLFFASVNDKNFLVDDTGNSRWWTISVKRINYQHTIDMQQLWAQIYTTLFLKGVQHWLTRDEELLLSANNKEYEQIDPIEERILTKYAFNVGYNSDGSKAYTYEGQEEILATDILIRIGYDRPDQRQRTKIGKILKSIGVQQKRTNRGSVYLMPSERENLMPAGYLIQNTSQT